MGPARTYLVPLPARTSASLSPIALHRMRGCPGGHMDCRSLMSTRVPSVPGDGRRVACRLDVALCRRITSAARLSVADHGRRALGCSDCFLSKWRPTGQWQTRVRNVRARGVRACGHRCRTDLAPKDLRTTPGSSRACKGERPGLSPRVVVKGSHTSSRIEGGTNPPGSTEIDARAGDA